MTFSLLSGACIVVQSSPSSHETEAGQNTSSGETSDGAASSTGPGTSSSGFADESASDDTPPSLCMPGRQSVDRPDDTDLPQVHAIYVLSSDAIDAELDLDGTISGSLASITEWMSAATDDRTLRLDTCEGELDVSFVRLDRTEAELATTGLFLRDELENELLGRGFDGFSGNGKIFAVYYSGGNDGLTCGGGAFPPQLVGSVGALYLGSVLPPPAPSCASEGFAAAHESPRYLDFALLHELFHTLGAVQSCAPHADGNAHTADLPSDLMYAGSEAWSPTEIDPGNDDYFGHGTDCLDVSRSAFLDPIPPAPQMPPGWVLR